MGRGFIDLLPWIPGNNIQGLNTPTHVDSVEMEMHGQKHKARWQKIQEQTRRDTTNISHMHNQKKKKRDIHVSQILVSCM